MVTPGSNKTLGRLPKTAVFGASGFIGKRFLCLCRNTHPGARGLDVSPAEPGVEHFDLGQPDITPLQLAQTGHTHALIVAAITRIAHCEQNRELSRRVNVAGTLELIRQLAEEGITPVFTSSDNVFDGSRGSYTETDPVNPITEYGRQKAEVEGRIGGLTGNRYLIVRLCKVFSLVKGDGSLLDEMARILTTGAQVRAAYDQVFCPVLVDDVLAAVTELLAKGVTGLVNVCSVEPWSRYDVACTLAAEMGLHKDRVLRQSLDEICSHPRHPHNTSMCIDRLLRETGVSLTPLAECIKAVAENWRAPRAG